MILRKLGLMMLLLTLSFNLFASSARQTIVSLDLCTDWILSWYATPRHAITYSPMIKRYPPPWQETQLHTHNLTLESILLMEPDHIMVGQYNLRELRQRLEKLGLNITVSSLASTLQEVQQMLLPITNILALPAQQIPSPIKVQSHSNRRALLLGGNGIAIGSNTLQDDIITTAGWDNYITTPGYSVINLEEVINDPPDILIVSRQNTPALANDILINPLWNKIINKNNIHTMDSWQWQCPGPWSFKLVEQLRSWH